MWYILLYKYIKMYKKNIEIVYDEDGQVNNFPKLYCPQSNIKNIITSDMVNVHRNENKSIFISNNRDNNNNNNNSINDDKNIDSNNNKTQKHKNKNNIEERGFQLPTQLKNIKKDPLFWEKYFEGNKPKKHKNNNKEKDLIKNNIPKTTTFELPKLNVNVSPKTSKITRQIILRHINKEEPSIVPTSFVLFGFKKYIFVLKLSLFVSIYIDIIGGDYLLTPGMRHKNVSKTTKTLLCKNSQVNLYFIYTWIILES